MQKIVQISRNRVERFNNIGLIITRKRLERDFMKSLSKQNKNKSTEGTVMAIIFICAI